MKYALCDSAGNFIQRCNDATITTLPAGAIELTDAQFDAGPGAYYAPGGVVQATPGPSAADQLAKARGDKATEISAACAAQIVGGQPSSALGAAHTYPTKPMDQSNLSASILDSLLPANTGNSAYVTPFWCMDSSGNWAWVNHTGPQIQQVGTDIKSAILAAQSKNATLQAQIQAASTIDAVNAIVW